MNNESKQHDAVDKFMKPPSLLWLLFEISRTMQFYGRQADQMQVNF